MKLIPPNISAGPWRQNKKLPRFVETACSSAPSSEQTPVAQCESMAESTTQEELANAQAIAALPDVLAALAASTEALQEAMQNLCDGDRDGQDDEAIDALDTQIHRNRAALLAAGYKIKE